MTDADKAPLDLAYRQAIEYLAGLAERPVGATADAEQLLKTFGGPLPPGPVSATETVELLGRAAAEGGIPTASGPRY
ncbi:aspartate aminotransferase family protein, partial [Streptomyces rubiginosohelvolus]